jgi:hypothetical protein
MFTSLIAASFLAGAIQAADDIDFTASGFAYATVFEDHNWQKDTNRIAVNLDATYSFIKLSTQIGTSEHDRHVRRATVELSQPIGERTAVFATYGIFPRLDSFHNNATDNPGSAGTAILPLSGYNYRMNTGTFNALEGSELKVVTRVWNDDLITARYAQGKMVIEDEKDVNAFLYSEYRKGIRVEATNNSNDYSIQYETSNWHFLYAKNFYSAESHLHATDPVSVFIASTYKNLTFTSERIGVKYQDRYGWIQTELIFDNAKYYDHQGKMTYFIDADNSYVIAGVFLNDHLSLYSGYSRGHGNTTNGWIKGQDKYIGITHETGNYAASVEYHEGYAQPWMKYGASPPYNWKSWVCSVTYRF